MIIGLGMPWRIAAAPHVVAMRDIAGLERRCRHAARITGPARTLQSMHQDQLASWMAAGVLLMHQHLDSRLRLIKNVLHRPAEFAPGTPPEISRDGRQMRILEEGFKGPQIVLYGVYCEGSVRRFTLRRGRFRFATRTNGMLCGDQCS